MTNLARRRGLLPVRLARVLAAPLATLAFVTALAFGAVLHLGLPPARSAAAELTVSWFNGFFLGKATLTGLSRMGPGGITADGIAIFDPAGRKVLEVEQLEVKLNLFSVLVRVLSGFQKLSLELDEVLVRRPSIYLLAGAGQTRPDGLDEPLSIAAAFALRNPGPKTVSQGRPVRVWLPQVRLERLYAQVPFDRSHTGEVSVPLALAAVLTTDRGVTIDVQRFGLRALGIGGVETLAVGEVSVRVPGAIFGEVKGKVGSLAVTQRFRIEGDRVLIEGELPSVHARALQPFIPGWPLDGTLRITNRVEGTLPRLHGDIEISAGGGTVHAQGLVTTAPDLEADLDVDTKDLDLHALSSELPLTRLNLRSAAEIWLGDEHPNWELNATLAESSYGATSLPVVDVKARYDERGLRADATLHERGLPAHLSVTGEPTTALDFSLELRQTSLDESPRLKALLAGARGQVSCGLQGRLAGRQLAVQVSAQARSLGYAAATVDSLFLTGAATANLDDLAAARAQLILTATDARAGPFGLPTFTLKSTGRLASPHLALEATTFLGAPLRLAADAQSAPWGLRALTGAIGSGSDGVSLTLRELTVGSGQLAAQGLHLESGGTLDADVVVIPGGGTANLHAQALDLSRLMAALGLERTVLSGRLDATVDVQFGADSGGRMELSLKRGAIAGVLGLDLQANTELDGKRLRGEARGSVDGVGSASATWNVLADGPLPDANSYQGAVGEVTVSLGDLDLRWLAVGLGERSPLTRSSGSLEADITLRRSERTAFPDVEFRALTHELSLDFGAGEDLRRVDALSLDLRGVLDPARQRAETALRLANQLGDVVTASGYVTLPLASWLAELPTPTALAETLAVAPLELVLLVPERPLRDFPQALQLPPLDGRLTARAVVRGTSRAPELELAVEAHQLRGPALPLTSAVDATLSARYQPKGGRLVGSVQATQGGNRIGSAEANLVLPLESLTETPEDGSPAWMGAAQVVFEGAPLGLITALSERGLRGTVQGSFGVERRNYLPDLTTDLRLSDLQVEGRRLGTGVLSGKTTNGRFIASARLDDEYGLLELNGSLGLKPSPWAVRIDPAAPVSLGLNATGYDAAVLAPALAGRVSEIGGALTGRLELRLTPPETAEAVWHASLGGQLALEDGVITPTAMGLRLTGAHLTLRAASSGGNNTLTLAGFRAKARSDTENLRGEAAAYFKNLTLERATFTLQPERFPLLVSGNKLADLSGTVRGELQVEGQDALLKLNLGGLVVEMPTGSAVDVIELAENPTVEVLQTKRPVEKAAPAAPSTGTLTVKTDLGRGVRVTSRLFTVDVRGEPQLEWTGASRVMGDVELVEGGRVQVLGKVFLIRQGRVMFDTEDATNPHLDVAATWKAASGVVVKATIGGTAQAPTLEWSSEPPLPGGESEIVALVLGGGGGSGGDGGRGQGIAYLAAAMNEVIGETGLRNVEIYAGRETEAVDGQVARLSERAWDSYTASVQLTEELWFQGSYRQGSAGPNTEPRSGVSGTLDWRFAPNWSASTEVGTLGFGLDLNWQYRY